jgi:hypothetical protein
MWGLWVKPDAHPPVVVKFSTKSCRRPDGSSFFRDVYCRGGCWVTIDIGN